jgi:hypothetical protein
VPAQWYEPTNAAAPNTPARREPVDRVTKKPAPDAPSARPRSETSRPSGGDSPTTEPAAASSEA